MASLIDKIQKIPTKVRAISFGFFIALLWGVYIMQFQIPMNTQIDQLQKSVAELQGKINANDEK